ncbi:MULTISPECIES: hypothetical protein [unclassified Pseudoalteromonas]|uniref:hypothetical protein n=1 Tax=unclassified Pseudoalteromonas TaxID=194690 RepID=UPI0012DE6D4C|nr:MULTISPECIES: hypothetical protein [unclassified Pseudoalteromonas]
MNKYLSLIKKYFISHFKSLFCPTATIPLFDTRQIKELNTASTLLKYPLKYFAQLNNVERVKGLNQGNTVLFELIDLLHEKHNFFQDSIILNNSDSKDIRQLNNVIDDELIRFVKIRSTLINGAPNDLKKIEDDLLYKEMNYNICENLNGLSICKKKLKSMPEAISELINCCWLSEHIALTLLGVVEVKKNNNEFVFQAKNKIQLRNVWFGDVFEKSSVDASIQSINKLAELTFSPNLLEKMDRDEFQNLHMRVLSLIPQHWRIGADGIVQVLFDEIADLIFIIVNVTYYSSIKSNTRPFRKSDIKKYIKANPKRTGMLKTYELIKDFQYSNKSEDRLFEISKEGLILGPVNQIRGLIQQTEYFAKVKLGETWHNELEDQQKKYLLDHLQSQEHLQVLDFELKPEHYGQNKPSSERLDIDFFIRDLSTSSVYAVQLKHVTSIKQSGLSFWLRMLATKNSKLNKGVLQLENLKQILSKYPETQEYLIKKGLTKTDINNLVPTLVHNIGSLDFMQLQEGIMVYDLHTFRKILTGRSATEERYDNYKYSFQESYGKKKKSLPLSEPCKIIDEYLEDERFKHFKAFDGPAHIKRSVSINEHIISSVGIGI